MKSADIRQSFIEFFVARGHKQLASAPLVPHGDPTLLFTNAGMVPFKEYFLGTDIPPFRRAVTVQKCMRVSGKHNDLENVGPSPRHHTFFEMLGNFSFGDYFKEEAIQSAWTLVTEVWGLSPGHLAVSVFKKDDEAAELWRKISGLPRELIVRCGEEDNFWAMGETGPCGPCSEIFVDCLPDQPRVEWETGTQSGRYLEIWNLVFMEFDRDADGELSPLPDPSIDTGAGLERAAAVLQQVSSNYDTDLFSPLLEATSDLAGLSYGSNAEIDISFRVIADHLRAVSFLLADGVIPGNEGRGYVLRRILRRALRHGMVLGFDEPFLHRLLPAVEATVGAYYPELTRAAATSIATIEAEEEKFLSTVAAASTQVQAAIDEIRHKGGHEIPGDTVFRFYDTYGLPLELIREIAEEERFEIDEKGFQVALEKQRRRSRESVGAAQQRLAAARASLREQDRVRTRFDGFDALQLDGVGVVALARVEGDNVVAAAELSPGDKGIAVLDRTCFYAEAGGQVGDRGILLWPGGLAKVSDTQKDTTGTYYHFVDSEQGSLNQGEAVRAEVEPTWRLPTERNHTATHLLHLALRSVLGESVRQAGSLVAPDRLRFDFTFARPLTDDELREIEGLVNRWILLARPTRIIADRSFEEAIAEGAMALFGEKYGDTVRTVEVAGLDVGEGQAAAELRSLELCGGCHVRNTGEIGLFLISGEKGVASGVRRIEALTGEAAIDQVRHQRSLLGQAAEALGVVESRVPGGISELRQRIGELDRQLSDLRMALVSSDEYSSSVEVEGIKVVAREVPTAPASEIRNMAEVLLRKLGSGVVVLGSREGEKVILVSVVSEDLTSQIHAGSLVRGVASLVGGSGGGRADFAQAGGREPKKLAAALDRVPELIRVELGS